MRTKWACKIMYFNAFQFLWGRILRRPLGQLSSMQTIQTKQMSESVVRHLIVSRGDSHSWSFMWAPLNRSNRRFMIFKMGHKWVILQKHKISSQLHAPKCICVVYANVCKPLHAQRTKAISEEFCKTLKARRSQIRNVPSSAPDASIQLASLV
jgi:hypothetical protein